jgi:hypothetical protein
MQPSLLLVDCFRRGSFIFKGCLGRYGICLQQFNAQADTLRGYSAFGKGKGAITGFVFTPWSRRRSSVVAEY